jgi:hypothetical protein
MEQLFMAVYAAGSPAVLSFLDDQKVPFDERSLLKLKSSFPEFLTAAEVETITLLACDMEWSWPEH